MFLWRVSLLSLRAPCPSILPQAPVSWHLFCVLCSLALDRSYLSNGIGCVLSLLHHSSLSPALRRSAKILTWLPDRAWISCPWLCLQPHCATGPPFPPPMVCASETEAISCISLASKQLEELLLRNLVRTTLSQQIVNRTPKVKVLTMSFAHLGY